METNILASVKKILGLSDAYVAFDEDIMSYINAGFSTMHQMDIGPDDGLSLEDGSEEWSDFIDVENGGNASLLNLAKTYINLQARLMFDPPQIGYLIDLKERQIAEYIWRIAEMRETEVYVPEYEEI